MSGVVRGYTDANEIYDLANGNSCYVFADEHNLAIDDEDTPPLPVAVVPLDDATLAACVERMIDANANGLLTCRCDGCKRAALKGLRAALGLEGGA